MPKFRLPKAEKGTVVINDRYVFVDGEMPVSKSDAPLIARILVEYHGCELVEDEEVEEKPAEKADGSLTADKTKAETKAAETKAAK